MRIEIKTRLTTANGGHEITLPLDQAKFDKSLTAMGILTGSPDEYEITHAQSNLDAIKMPLTYAGDIEELNFLAQLLDRFDDGELEAFGAIAEGSGDIPSMIQLVNMAYNFYDFGIEQSVHDVEDLGGLYVEGNDPDSDELILRNTDPNGTIDYEGVGMELHISQRGGFTAAGYVKDYREHINKPYDGRFFPPYCYSGDSYMGILLTKQGEEKGVDIFLPATDTALQRALRRIGADDLSECSMRGHWGIPPRLSCEILPGIEFGAMNAAAQKLAVLPMKQVQDILKSAHSQEFNTATEFADFFDSVLSPQAPAAESTVTYYFPLDVQLLEYGGYDDCDGEYGDMNDGAYSIAPSDAVWYKDIILEHLKKENSSFDTDRMLAEYFGKGSPLDQKIYSMLPTVEEHGCELWGAMVMRIKGELSPNEVSALKDYIEGQNSDGYGEGLEQREIKTSDGELYVHFWSSNNKSYTIYTQEEFARLQEQRQDARQYTVHPASNNRKPDCPMIGADGNVFNLIGLVSRTLKDNGMPDKAKEMGDRVRSSGSYEEALAIMTEYVNPVSQDAMRHSGGFSMRM